MLPCDLCSGVGSSMHIGYRSGISAPCFSVGCSCSCTRDRYTDSCETHSCHNQLVMGAFFNDGSGLQHARAVSHTHQLLKVCILAVHHPCHKALTCDTSSGVLTHALFHRILHGQNRVASEQGLAVTAWP